MKCPDCNHSINEHSAHGCRSYTVINPATWDYCKCKKSAAAIAAAAVEQARREAYKDAVKLVRFYVPLFEKSDGMEILANAINMLSPAEQEPQS